MYSMLWTTTKQTTRISHCEQAGRIETKTAAMARIYIRIMLHITKSYTFGWQATTTNYSDRNQSGWNRNICN